MPSVASRPSQYHDSNPTRCIVAYVSLGLRFYTRLKYATWVLDDWLMLAAVLPFTALSATGIGCAFVGIGAHNKTLSLPENREYQELGRLWFYLFEVFYCAAIIPVKLSICMTIVRLAQGRRIYVFAQYAIMILFVVMNIVAAGFTIFFCNPPEAMWKPELLERGATCMSIDILVQMYYARCAINIFTDWATAIMPIPLLWNVKMDRTAKASVASILGLGFFASISACVRLKYMMDLTDSNDFLYNVNDVVIWAYAENGLGLIAGCLMTLRPLFRNIFHLDWKMSISSGIRDKEQRRQQHAAAGTVQSGQEHGDDAVLGRRVSAGEPATSDGGDTSATTQIRHGDREDDWFITEIQGNMAKECDEESGVFSNQAPATDEFTISYEKGVS